MNNIKILFLGVTIIAFAGCSALQKIDVDKVIGGVEQVLGEDGLSNTDVIAGLKEALSLGATNAVKKVNVADGFLKNELIKIALPKEAQKVADVLTKNLGPIGEKVVNDFVVKLNRTAEDASAKAKPIFISAVKNITIQDGFSILKGADNEATQYLKGKTYNKLVTAFKPDIETSLNKVKLNDAWRKVTNLYNKIPGAKPVEVDLAQYTTDQATAGLFKLIEVEEKKIRKDPAARVSDILKKVFSTLD